MAAGSRGVSCRGEFCLTWFVSAVSTRDRLDGVGFDELIKLPAVGVLKRTFGFWPFLRERNLSTGVDRPGQGETVGYAGHG